MERAKKQQHPQPLQADEPDAEAANSNVESTATVISPSSATKTATSTTALFDKYLRYPSAPNASSKTKRNDQLPKAVSGSTFIAYLKEKDKKKMDEEERRQRKRKAREQMDKEKKRTTRETKTRNSSAKPETVTVNQDECACCDRPYNYRPSEWIGCDNCDRWYHKTVHCTGIGDIEHMSAEEVEELQFLCDYCL